ncbi:MAG TPA: hypothetical protein VL997_06675 [Dyella sp.]|nr:hypothetical protein [Dyella sp.]
MKAICFLVGVIALLATTQADASVCAAPSQATSVAVPGHPFSAIPAADNCWMFVSIVDGKGHGSVAVLRNKDGVFQLDHTVALKHPAFGASLSHDGRTLVVAGDDNTSLLDVTRLEQGDSNAVLGTLSDGSKAGAVYATISPGDKMLFVSDEYAKRISVFDFAKARNGRFDDSALIGRIPTAAFPVGLAFSPDGHWLYATSQRGPASMQSVCKPELPQGQMHPEGLLLRIDVAKASSDPAHAVVDALPAGCNPVRVAVSPSGKDLWVTARGGNALISINADDWVNGSKQAHVASLPIGPSPVGIAARQDGKQVWVALSNRFGSDKTGQLVGISDPDDAAQKKLVTLPAAGFPRELTFLSDGRTLVATLYDAQQVELVPTPN